MPDDLDYYNEVTSLMDDRRAMDVFELDFSKSFSSITYLETK